MQVLPRPVFGLNGFNGHLFIGQQRDQVFTGGTACGKMAVALPPRWVMARATLIPPPPGSKTGALQRNLPSG
jgi:hypothetical protein